MSILSKLKNGLGAGGGVMVGLEIVSKLLKNKSVQDESRRIEQELNAKMEQRISELSNAALGEIKALKTVSRLLLISVIALCVINAGLIAAVIYLFLTR